MVFNYKGNYGIEIKFEESDNATERRIVEQGISFIRNLLTRMNELPDKNNPVKIKVD